jgi:hypothetical protein
MPDDLYLPGQCLVSDGFETRIGRADKAKGDVPLDVEKLR